MIGRPKIFDEKTALASANELFWKKGYEATSTEELIKVMKIQRGSFYHSFKSKKELFIKAVNTHETSVLQEFRDELLKSETPMQVIRDMFLSIADCTPERQAKGCILGNTIAELAGIDDELVKNATYHLKTLEEIFFTQIQKSQETKELKTTQNPALLAKYLLNLWNGLNITRRIYTKKEDLLPLIIIQLEIIK